MRDLSALMRPRSVAIVGDSAGNGRGATIHEHLLRWGFDGPIYSVNPRYDSIRGNKCYPSLLDLPESVDFVASALRADLSVNVLSDAGQLGAKAALFIASGFAEADDVGREWQEKLRETADQHGILFCGPNCYGVANLHGNFAAYSGRIGKDTPRGSIALVFQSGALTHGILEPSPARGIGYSYIVTTGNEASVTLSDYVDHIANDPNTRVIGCFVESFRNLPGFLDSVERAISNGKHVVVLKVGRSARATKAALAHTGALVGDDRLISAALRKVGAVRVSDLDEFVETLVLLDSLPPALPSSEVALASISGGGSGVMADLAGDLDLHLADFSEPTTETLTGLLPAFGTVNNPLDITGAVAEQPRLLEDAVEAVLQDPSVGMLGYALNTPTYARDDRRAQGSFGHDRTIGAIAAGQQRADNGAPVVLFTMTSGAFDEDLVKAASDNNIPLLQGMREGILALSRVQAAARYRGAVQASTQRLGPAPDVIRRVIDGSHTDTFSEQESKDLFAAAGITVGKSILAHSLDEAVAAAERIGLPVALKADSREILHKTDVGVVALDIQDTDEVAREYKRITDLAVSHLGGDETLLRGVSVQEMAPDGIDFLVGLTNAPGVGPAVTLGLGGTLTEVIGEVSTCLAPVTPQEAGIMLDELRMARKLLAGARGRPPADSDALIDSVVRASWLAEWLQPVLNEAEINPIRVLEAGRGAVALDALVLLRGKESA